MNFHHSQERQMLADTLGRYLRGRYPIERRDEISGSDAGWSSEDWAGFAKMGVIGALFGEEVGGFGGGGFDLAVVFEQLGGALVVEPFLGVLMAGRALAKAGGQQSLLDDVIAGTCVLAFAHQEPQNGYGAEDVASHAEQSARGWILNGAKAVVAQVKAANLILVSAQVPGGSEAAPRLGLFLVDVAASGLSVRDYPLIDGGRGGELIMNSTPAALVAERALPLIEDAIAAGIVGLSWEAVGVMDVLKATTLDYLRTRMQFGTPIGKFQTLRHRMATLALEIEQARSSAINASYALESDRQTRERAISAAKYTIGRVGTLVAEEAIQMHGGIGMTWELPLSHYAKRLIMIGHQLGDEDHHLARFSRLARAV